VNIVVTAKRDIDSGSFYAVTSAFDAHVTLVTDVVVGVPNISPTTGTMSAYAMLGKLDSNITDPTAAAALAASISVGVGVALNTSTPNVPFAGYNAVYQPVSAPGTTPIIPPKAYSYFKLTVPQKVGVAFAVLFGVALIVAVVLGLWYVSRTASTASGASVVTATNSRSKSTTKDSDAGNTSKDTQHDANGDATDDDEEDDGEDDGEEGAEEEELSESQESEEESSANSEEESEEEEEEEEDDDDEETS